MKTTVKLSETERAAVLKRMSKDIRVIELNKTRKVRPLNILEKIMLKQIYSEYVEGVC